MVDCSILSSTSMFILSLKFVILEWMLVMAQCFHFPEIDSHQ